MRNRVSVTLAATVATLCVLILSAPALGMVPGPSRDSKAAAHAAKRRHRRHHRAHRTRCATSSRRKGRRHHHHAKKHLAGCKVGATAARARHRRHRPGGGGGGGGTGGSSGLTATALSPYEVQLSWPAVSGATTTSIYNGSSLIDQFPAGSDDSYTVRELWPQSSYTFTVDVSPAGGSTQSFSATVSTPAASSSFARLYAGSAFINTPIGPSPSLDPNSAGMVSSALAAYQSNANLSNNDEWGIPIVAADDQSSSYVVGCLEYDCSFSFPAVHIPTMAEPDTGSDGHLVVLEPDGSEMDMWTANKTGSGWDAGSRWLTTDTGSAVNCTTFNGCGGADVADFALAAGLVRPEEIAQGHIDHALMITTPDTRSGYVACPAEGTDGTHSSPDALPIGAHVQLDPSIDVSALPIPSWQKVIATALQQYGAYVGDTGGSLAVEAESNLGRPGYDAWAQAGVPSDSPSLSDLPWSSMRVLSMTQCGS